jgi:hypothetical protein
MSDPFTSLGAVPLAGFVVLTIGTLLLVRREPRTSPLAYLLLASGVGLGTFVAWGQVQAAIDRQWAIDRADQAECFVPRQTGTLPRLLTTEAGAHAALSAGRTEQAAHWAQQLLYMAQGHENDRDYGSAIHAGNIVLGRIAVQRGDIEAGKRHLLAAGNTPGSPTLNSFGPDMLLARELLVRGETETVLLYFDMCQAFWDREELGQWRLAVASGRVPDFEGNFHY